MHKILSLLSLWTLFSIDFLGFSLYPSYLPILLLLFKIKIKYTKSIKIFIVCFLSLSLIAIVTKLHLIVDVVRAIVMVCYFIYLKNFFTKDKIFDITDISVGILVAYGCFQYIAFLTGYGEYGAWLHNQIGYEGLGGPYDARGGIPRVSSLTSEPSYFAFTVGIYLFITKKILVKVLCIIGYFISFSFISIYGALGLIGFYILHKLLKIDLFLYMILIFIVQVLFVYTYYANLAYIETFTARYTGLSEYLASSNIVELLIGIPDTAGQIITIKRPYSNISSLVVNFGIIGLIAYLYFIAKIGKKNNMAALAMYLYSFNYYYLTGWPSFVVFLYMIYIDGKSTSISNRTLLQFRKDHSAITQLNQRTNLSSSRNNLHR
ncbi:hypothetical protein [Laspinema olomoucense]|uniref:Uncharacterized protein n=1 Tax=Laspinema olomoucense D3b TaxID=2953688 RepID=A0ABT2N3Y3_9CYAN|nr:MULTISPECIES: hypothetical protein [unclassified Laspinema]MCT7977396.1 hypothetical protein [Laspinema sp. D3b]MCT7986815.1 hypothetical protein [Laspinema sp. D3a]